MAVISFFVFPSVWLFLLLFKLSNKIITCLYSSKLTDFSKGRYQTRCQSKINETNKKINLPCMKTFQTACHAMLCTVDIYRAGTDFG